MKEKLPEGNGDPWAERSGSISEAPGRWAQLSLLTSPVSPFQALGRRLEQEVSTAGAAELDPLLGSHRPGWVLLGRFFQAVGRGHFLRSMASVAACFFKASNR